MTTTKAPAIADALAALSNDWNLTAARTVVAYGADLPRNEKQHIGRFVLWRSRRGVLQFELRGAQPDSLAERPTRFVLHFDPETRRPLFFGQWEPWFTVRIPGITRKTTVTVQYVATVVSYDDKWVWGLKLLTQR